VLKPLTEHCRFDLVLDVDGNRLFRVQCKWAPRKGNVVVVNLAGYRHTSTGEVRSIYTAEEIDAVGVYCQDLDRCYLLPVGRVAGRRGLHLRLGPPKNGQRAGLNWAADYEFSGAVAQLGRAPAWHAGGQGFESPQLHAPSDAAGASTVGAHEFRNHFGWYMERAAAGEQFHVTRRGKAHVCLGPAQPPIIDPTTNGSDEPRSSVA
jgi:prevent-host-death family protein